MAKSVISDLLRIFKSSVSAVIAENLIKRNLQYNSITEQLTICGNIYNLKNKNIYLIGSGKAVRNMAVEVENMLQSKIKKGIVSIPVGSIEPPSKIVAYHQGAKNNLPDKYAEETTRKIVDLVTGLQKDDLLLVLISGGGSALLSLTKPPVTSAENVELIKRLANSGADIKELNTVRKKLSEVKGGRLAIKAQPAQVVSLILSDVIGDPIDFIASGPTAENTDKSTKAWDIINKYNLTATLPNSIKTVLENSEKEPFPHNNIKNYVIGSNKISIQAAAEEARLLNYLSVVLSNTVSGNVKDVAMQYTKLTEEFCKYLKGNSSLEELQHGIYEIEIPGIKDLGELFANNVKENDICLVLGGEITVEVKGTGVGGRNQQLALEFSKYIYKIKDKFEGFEIYLLSAGTDGIDGPTDAAGAIGYKDLVSDANQENLDVDRYLENNDSYNFYKQFHDGNLHVITGITNTNVMDIHLIVIRKSE